MAATNGSGFPFSTQPAHLHPALRFVSIPNLSPSRVVHSPPASPPNCHFEWSRPIFSFAFVPRTRRPA
jgi:hypothetical protein